jgi:phosphatidylethanolamine-binding protein (PEBP) family uncharacterized protein
MAVAGVPLAALLGACSNDDPGTAAADRPIAETMEVTSAQFTDGGTIPAGASCDDEAPQSPPLAWSGVPDGAAELALVVTDPDAPKGTFFHLVLLGIDPSATGVAGGQRGWKALCPPKGQTHRYVFTVYALQSRVVASGATSSQGLIERIQDRAIAKGVLTGRFGR